MKFTNGYWMLRDEIEASYAVEYAKHTVNGNKLEVYLPAKHMSGRGDALNIALLTLTLSSPSNPVLRRVLSKYQRFIIRECLIKDRLQQ